VSSERSETASALVAAAAGLAAPVDTLVRASREAGRATLASDAASVAVVERLGSLAFESPEPELLGLVCEAFACAQVATSHPRYFGLPHGTPGVEASLAASLAATFDAELATKHHAPGALALERATIAALGRSLLPCEGASGIVTSGASEATLTALLVALARTWPEHPRRGLRALDKDPVVFASIEAHPSLRKALRIAGLGDRALVAVAVDAQGRMRIDALRAALGRERGRAPVLIVATLGTTSLGAVDPIAAIAELAANRGIALHVDAAFGGVLALTEGAEPSALGLDRADTVAFDAHKALPVPLASGTLFVREPAWLEPVFSVGASYLPKTRAGEPWATSMPWSRGARAMPLAFALGALGRVGVAGRIARRLALGTRLRGGLAAAGFTIANDTPLPVVVARPTPAPMRKATALLELATAARARAEAFVSIVRLPDGSRALRAAVTSDATTEADVDALVDALAVARGGLAL
jgi:aromatic-L-amino-acid decarboxylase